MAAASKWSGGDGLPFQIADRALKDRSEAMLERFEKAKAEAMRQLSSRP